jgi:hypothetical protein
LRTALVFDGSMVFFEDVPAGDYTLELSGDYWQPDHLPFKVDAHRTGLPEIKRSLVTRPLGRMDLAGGDGSLARV